MLTEDTTPKPRSRASSSIAASAMTRLGDWEKTELKAWKDGTYLRAKYAGKKPQERVSLVVPRNLCQGPQTVEEIRWMEDLSEYYIRAMKPEAARWSARATEARRRDDDHAASYARRRALNLATALGAKLAVCGTRRRVVQCQCKRISVPVGCGQKWLCPTCRQGFYRRIRRKLARAVWMHLKARRRPGKRDHAWRILTLTARHSGDLAYDRQRIVRAWKLLRTWYHTTHGESFPFAMTWETTTGRDKKGHVHAHVIALWPPFVPYSPIIRQWKRAIGDDRARFQIERAKKGPNGAAVYIAKYITKGVELGEGSALFASRVLAMNYGKRCVNISVRFWRPIDANCKCCGSPWLLLEKPAALAPLIAGETWKAASRLAGSVIGYERGPPQYSLPLPEPDVRGTAAGSLEAIQVGYEGGS